MQESYDFLGKHVVVSSAIDELRDKQHFFESSEVDKVKRSKNPHYWFLRDIVQINAFQFIFFSQLSVLDAMRIPQIGVYSLFLRNVSRLNYQLIQKNSDQSCFKSCSDQFSEQELLPILIRTENVHPNYNNQFQTNTETLT